MLTVVACLLSAKHLRLPNRSGNSSSIDILSPSWPAHNQQQRITHALSQIVAGHPMPHRFCCPHQRSLDHSNDTPEPCRPPMALDSTFTQGFLPQDHPHAMTGRRLLLPPVDFIMKSPRIADKIKLKMSKKSTKNFRKELTESHYPRDAHVLTSSEVLDMTSSGTFDGTIDAGSNRAQIPNRATQRFGTSGGPQHMSGSRLVVSSPSIYSRSPSRIREEEQHRVADPIQIASMSDLHGSSYRSILPCQASSSGSQSMQARDREHSHQKSVHSRHWSGSTESTIQRRLEQSALDYVTEPVAISSSSHYTAQSDRQVSSRQISHRFGTHELEHKEYA